MDGNGATTIRDYLRSAVNGILQEGNKGLLDMGAKFSEIDFNLGKKRLRIASELLEKGWPLETKPHQVINIHGSLGKVPVSGEEAAPVKESGWLEDKKKVLSFVKKWGGEDVNKPIDFLPVIPSAGDILDLGILLWEENEIKEPDTIGHKDSLYYVSLVTIGCNHVKVTLVKYLKYLVEMKKTLMSKESRLRAYGGIK